MDLPLPTERFLHQIDVLDDARVHRGHFTRMVAAKNVIELIQRRQIVLPLFIPIAHAQPFIGMHVVERQFALRQSFGLSTRKTWLEKPFAEAEHAGHGCFQ